MAISPEMNGVVDANQNAVERYKALGLGKLLCEEPSGEQYRELCILLSGIPKITEDRLEKLKGILNKIFDVVKPLSVEYPMDQPATEEEKPKTKGYCFLMYESKETADSARMLLDGYKFDRNHTFNAYSFTALSDIKEPEKKWEPPKKEAYIDVGDLWWWLDSASCQDQFAIQVDNPMSGVIHLAVYWNGRAGTDPQIVDDEKANREMWSELPNFEWSPHGSYLVTFHPKGVRLWGGDTFQPVKRYMHVGVDYAKFSPCEKFLMTYSMMHRFDPKAENELKIYEVFTGQLKKTLSPPRQSEIHESFKWSYDDSFMAMFRPKSGKLHVYETSQFNLHENKAIELPGLVAFEWNPAKNQIACYCEAQLNVPAEISIIEFPSQRKLRAVRVQMVSMAKLCWQKSGQYLAAYTGRYTKLLKVKAKDRDEDDMDMRDKEPEVKFAGSSHHVEIFDCTEKEIPVQTVQLPEAFVDMGWEPKGDKFCVLARPGGTPKVSTLIYKLDKGKPAPLLISRLEGGTNLTTVDWAPQGGWLVVHGAGSSQGQLHFIDANGTEATRFRTNEFPMLGRGLWDPTGRYYAACSLSFYRQNDGHADAHGYRIYSFQGRELVKKHIETLLQFKWRPRPPVVLPDETVRTVKKNIKTLSQKFEEEDRAELLQVSKELLQERRKVLDAFQAIRDENRRLYSQEESTRHALRPDVDALSEISSETIITPFASHVEPLNEDE